MFFVILFVNFRRVEVDVPVSGETLEEVMQVQAFYEFTF